MNARSRCQAEAWRFIEWASSAEFLLRSVFEGNMNPTRASVWDDPRVEEHVAGWGTSPRSRASSSRAARVSS